MPLPSKISLPEDAGDIILGALSDRRNCYELFDTKVMPVLKGYLAAKYDSLQPQELEEILSMLLERLAKGKFRTSHSGPRATQAFSCWLTKTAYCRFIDYRKRMSAQKRAVDPEDMIPIGQEDDWISNECSLVQENTSDIERKWRLRTAMETALTCFDIRERRALKSLYVDGIPLQAAARAAGMKPSEMRKLRASFKCELKQAYEIFDIERQ